mmetsp:Transcript_2601/g.6257  ORF Transcript_2601/g.6257 Transcript_2601/m.6257 type:complete len:215 (+) Transcript_2601:1102-1746(+)
MGQEPPLSLPRRPPLPNCRLGRWRGGSQRSHRLHQRHPRRPPPLRPHPPPQVHRQPSQDGQPAQLPPLLQLLLGARRCRRLGGCRPCVADLGDALVRGWQHACQGSAVVYSVFVQRLLRRARGVSDMASGEGGLCVVCLVPCVVCVCLFFCCCLLLFGVCWCFFVSFVGCVFVFVVGLCCVFLASLHSRACLCTLAHATRPTVSSARALTPVLV